MPEGIMVMRYNQRSGIAIKAQYPEGKMDLKEDALMHIFNLHEFSEEAGTASLTIDNLSITTYYSGSKFDYFIIIKLNALEDPDDYEESLNNISHIILENLENDKYVEMLPSLFKEISEISEAK